MSVTSEQDELDLGLPDPVDWRDDAMEILLQVANRGLPFQAYDLTQAGLANPRHPNQWGAFFLAAQHEGYIVPVRWTHSNRQTRAAGVCREWIGTEFADASRLVA